MAKLYLLACIILVVILLYFEGKRYVAPSKALWVPTIWMLITGSRPISGWSESSGNWVSAESVEAGSPVDRWVLFILLALGLCILFRRKIAWSKIIRNNKFLFIIFTYIALSVLWSEFPFVSFKRWFRACGPIVMALVVLTEPRPEHALESVVRRCAYVLIPFSIVLVKFFDSFGRSYARWDGREMWTGVTTHKNSLGQMCAVSVFFLIMAILSEWQSGDLYKNKLQVVSDVLVIAIALILLKGPSGSMSASSIGILIVGISISLLFYRMKNFAKNITAHLEIVIIGSVLAYIFLFDTVVGIVAPIFGRDSTLTDRTEIWDFLLDIASRNPIFGVGYGAFWGMDEAIISQLQVGQAHNGYLDVYLELGIVGLVLLSGLLLDFCGKIKKRFHNNFHRGVFGISFLMMTLIYNNVESSFLQTGFLWTIMILLMVVFSESGLQEKSGSQLEIMGQSMSRNLKRDNRLRHSVSRYKRR